MTDDERELIRWQGTDYDPGEPDIHWDGEWLDVIHGFINTTYSSYRTKKADCHVPTLEGCKTKDEAVAVVVEWYKEEASWAY